MPQPQENVPLENTDATIVYLEEQHLHFKTLSTACRFRICLDVVVCVLPLEGEQRFEVL